MNIQEKKTITSNIKGATMTKKSFDIIVPKEYPSQQDGKSITKTAWNRVGRAWPSKSGESVSFELYMFPNQRYVIQLTDKREDNQNDNVPF